MLTSLIGQLKRPSLRPRPTSPNGLLTLFALLLLGSTGQSLQAEEVHGAHGTTPGSASAPQVSPPAAETNASAPTSATHPNATAQATPASAASSFDPERPMAMPNQGTSAGHSSEMASESPAHNAATQEHGQAAAGASEGSTHGAASDGHDTSHGGDKAGGSPHKDEHHAHHANHGALFLGATSTSEGLFPSLGLEYERRLEARSGLFGVTAFAEFTATAAPFALLGAGLLVHPVGGLRVMAIAGAEISLSSEAAAAETPETEEETSHRMGALAESSEAGSAAPLARLGVAYDFHVGKFAFSPSVFVDYAHEHFTPVAGLALGVGF